MFDFTRLVEKLMDSALTDSGVRGAVAWFTIFLLGLLTVEASLLIMGLFQFRREAGLAFVVCVAVDFALLRWLDLKNPWKWFCWFNGIAIALSLLGLAYRLVTGNWEPLIPEYVPAP